jgi:hypothetical protein
MKRTLVPLRETSGVGQKHLRKQIIPANLEDLRKAMRNKPELNMLLNMTAEEFKNSEDKYLKKYLFFIQEVTNENKNKTLLNVIEASLDWHIVGTKMVSLFSKDQKGNLAGFAAYLLKDQEVI